MTATMGNFTKTPTSTRTLAGEVTNTEIDFNDRSADDLSTPKGYIKIRYGLERMLAILLLVAFLPIIFVLTCIVRLNSKGAAIYKQTRVGLNGREFSMFKIRTMVADAEQQSGPAWCSESDPRITRVGQLLRFLHLDELPQLFNVAMGDMSFIGPRPERPEFVAILSKQVNGYAQRLRVKPGITGLAQIYLPADQTLKCVIKKVKMDRAYIETVTLGVDLRIALCTVFRMVGLRHGKGPRLMGLDREYQHIIKECKALDLNQVESNEPSDFHTDLKDSDLHKQGERELETPVFIGGEEFENIAVGSPNKPR